MKSVNVSLSNAQASQIESIAAMLEITPGELMTLLSFMQIEGFDGSPSEAVSSIRAAHGEYNDRRLAPGKEIEAVLRGGLMALPLEDFLDVADAASHLNDDHEDQTQAHSRMDAFFKAGVNLMAQAN